MVMMNRKGGKLFMQWKKSKKIFDFLDQKTFRFSWFNQKGSMMQTVVIALVILLLSAGVLWAFIGNVPFEEIIDKEACHDSVLLRASFFLRGLPETMKPPLQCKTEKVLIEKVSDEAISREVANEMYECWWMLGEGKLDFFGDYAGKLGFGQEKARCVICSVVGFDDVVREKNKEIEGFGEFLENEKVPSSSKDITYLGYFTGQENAEMDVKVDVADMRTDEKYAVVFMNLKGMTFESAVWKTVGIGGGTAAGVGLLKKAAKIAIKKAFWPVALVTTAADGYFVFATYQAASEKCDTGKGCNALLLIPYEAAELNKMCDRFESKF